MGGEGWANAARYHAMYRPSVDDPEGFWANGASAPDLIQWAPYLPKTRSGKVMRRILRKIAEGDYDNLGDVPTLADPRVVQIWLTIAWGADNAVPSRVGLRICDIAIIEVRACC